MNIAEEEYLPTIRNFFRVMSEEIKRISENETSTANLTAHLKEIAWDTLEKYRDDYLSRKQ